MMFEYNCGRGYLGTRLPQTDTLMAAIYRGASLPGTSEQSGRKGEHIGKKDGTTKGRSAGMVDTTGSHENILRFEWRR